MINDKLKKIIFGKLYQDLKNIEIIQYNESIWFIDREDEYWYFEYKISSGDLFYRLTFFDEFFLLFSIENKEYKWVISEWVEEVLNCKVETPGMVVGIISGGVEEVLNYKVETPMINVNPTRHLVKEVLNYKVEKPVIDRKVRKFKVEEVLKHKVETPINLRYDQRNKVEEVLNCKVENTTPGNYEVMFRALDMFDSENRNNS